jgi:DnaK suppressor protein
VAADRGALLRRASSEPPRAAYILAMTGPHRDDVAIEARLRARRAELVQAAAAHEDDRRPVQLDQTRMGRLSRMEAVQEQAMAIEIERRREVEMARIDAALERLAEGEYGSCVTCGEAIEPQRLELDPATPLCLACAKRAD